MWSGETTNIPSGWFLCDGQNGTPDLRNRFIVGAGNNYDVGDTGGSDSVRLSVAQIPSHSHSGRTSGSSTLSFVQGSATRYLTTTAINTGNTITGFSTTAGESYATKFLMNLSVTTNSTGGSSSHENRPPYYALAYIMKA